MAAFPARDKDAFTAHWTKILSDDTVVKKTIVLDGQVAGNVVSFDLCGERLVGYWIGREYWGKGVATKGLTEFLGEVKVRPLHARVAKHNAASIRVLQKCGFTISGRDACSSNVPVGDQRSADAADEKNDASDACADKVEEFVFALH